MTVLQRSVPQLCRDWALFLDLDGTLIDLAASPDAVIVPQNLAQDLAVVRDKLGGALAIVSGRPMRDLDRLLAPLDLPCAAEHGAVIRRNGVTTVARKPVPQAWRQTIRNTTRDWQGVLVEEKQCVVAVHYRHAPHYAGKIEALLLALAGSDSDFSLLTAHMAFEIRARNVDKGHAVRTLMEDVPFQNRTPVFVGDDVTDEDGMREAVRQGGLGLHVSDVFGGATENVRRWLREMH